ncbi:MAG: hypothetical protein LBJ88_01070 [Campylobacteraceae bacterium]|nr:hypothetical protein [Campylobacteraceae bacterium]
MKKLIMVLRTILVLLASLLPIISIICFYRNSITENVVGFLWIFPAAFGYYELRKYNRLFVNRSFGVKSTKELLEIKTKIKIEIFADILQNISFAHTILFILISLMLLYDDARHNHMIIFGVFCVIILNAFTYLNMPKYEKLLMSSFNRGYKKISKDFFKSINELYKKIERDIFKKIIISLFIALAFMIPMGMVITVLATFICNEEYILAMFFINIAIITFMSMFAASIYYVSNLVVSKNEKRHDLSFEVLSTVVICLYFFGSKESK